MAKNEFSGDVARKAIVYLDSKEEQDKIMKEHKSTSNKVAALSGSKLRTQEKIRLSLMCEPAFRVFFLMSIPNLSSEEPGE